MRRKNDISKLKSLSRKLRKDILDISYNGGIGHIGPALSIIDILCVLYFDTMNVSKNKLTDKKRDRLILSKGHAVAALYSVLYRRGYITRKELFSYCKDGGLGEHPDKDLKIGIEFSSGSLGHGLSVACGMAWGLMTKNKTDGPRVFAVLSDAELNEGSTWEAIMFASHHKLNNLTVIIDANGFQAFGQTKDIINLGDIKRKWEMHDWYSNEIDGHDLKNLALALKKRHADKPSVVIARTTNGKGVTFMEKQLQWHYLSLNEENYKKALKSL